MNPLFVIMGIVVVFFLIASIAAHASGVFLRIVLNAFFGVIAISVLNSLFAGRGLYIGTNPFTVGMISLFGIPGFLSVAALGYFL